MHYTQQPTDAPAPGIRRPPPLFGCADVPSGEARPVITQHPLQHAIMQAGAVGRNSTSDTQSLDSFGIGHDRADGGRGFFMGGVDFHDNLRTVEDFRRFLLNGIVWAAGRDVPEGGVQSTVAFVEAGRAAAPQEAAKPAANPAGSPAGIPVVKPPLRQARTRVLETAPRIRYPSEDTRSLTPPGDMAKKTAALETPAIQSLGRGLSILEAVADSPEPVPLKQLTDLLGIDRSSVFRLANTLRQRQFLANPDGRKDYVLGPSAWRLSRKHGRSMLISLCREQLKTLAQKTGETSHLAVREGSQALFVDHQAATGQVLTVSGQTGEFVPLHCTAHGKALLADMAIEELKEMFGAAPLRAHTKRSIASLDALARACKRIHADGFATDDGEYSEELRCVAAPIRDRDGLIVASIGISAPSTRFPKERFAIVASQVAEVAADISTSFSRS